LKEIGDESKRLLKRDKRPKFIPELSLAEKTHLHLVGFSNSAGSECAQSTVFSSFLLFFDLFVK
jgi:hypothetical protein